MIIEALTRLAPGVEFTVEGEEYKDIVWPNDIALFTEDEVMSEIAKIKNELSLVRATKDAKAARDFALQNLTHKFTDGRIVQVRPQDEQPINTAIDIMDRNQIAEFDWYDANNNWIKVSLQDLQGMKISGQDQAAAIWADFKIKTGGS